MMFDHSAGMHKLKTHKLPVTPPKLQIPNTDDLRNAFSLIGSIVYRTVSMDR